MSKNKRERNLTTMDGIGSLIGAGIMMDNANGDGEVAVQRRRGRKPAAEMQAEQQVDTRVELEGKKAVDGSTIDFSNPDTLLTIKQAADYLRVSLATVNNYRKPNKKTGEGSLLEFQDYETEYFKTPVVRLAALQEFEANRQKTAANGGNSSGRGRGIRGLKVRMINAPMTDEQATLLQQLIDGHSELNSLGWSVVSREEYNRKRKEEKQSQQEEVEQAA